MCQDSPLGTRDTLVDKTDKNPYACEVHIAMGRGINKHK